MLLVTWGVLAVTATLTAAPTASANSFVVRCASSHLRNDDPIVFPGRPGASHRHEFFGASNVHAGSTAAELRAAPTTCAHAADTASYWAPSLEVDGRLVRGDLHAYYERAGKSRAAAPPQGLRVIAGDMRAATPQSMRVTTWQCVGRVPRPETRTVPACRAGERLGAWIRFPDCWNGRQLDSPDHRSHLARSWKGTCPSTHPVPIMRLAMRVTWNVRPRTPDAITLGGGALSSTGMHADFWNTWRQPALVDLRWQCIEVARNCGEVRTVGSNPAPTRVEHRPFTPPSPTTAAGCCCCAPRRPSDQDSSSGVSSLDDPQCSRRASSVWVANVSTSATGTHSMSA